MNTNNSTNNDYRDIIHGYGSVPPRTPGRSSMRTDWVWTEPRLVCFLRKFKPKGYKDALDLKEADEVSAKPEPELRALLLALPRLDFHGSSVFSNNLKRAREEGRFAKPTTPAFSTKPSILYNKDFNLLTVQSLVVIYLGLTLPHGFKGFIPRHVGQKQVWGNEVVE